MVLLGRFGQAANNGCLVVGIVLAPFCTVVRVVLGSVNINVQFVLAIKVKLALAVGVAPWVAIKAFNHATLRTGGVVLNFDRHHLGLCQYLQQRLHTVVCASVVGAGHHNAVGGHFQVVALGC